GFREDKLAKNGEITTQLDRQFDLIRDRGVKLGFSTDLIGGQQHQVNREFTLRKPYFSNLDILRQATSESAEILRMCGPLDRYGRFGEVREGWLADLIVVDGNPLDDVAMLEDHANRIALVMKGGRCGKKNKTPEVASE